MEYIKAKLKQLEKIRPGNNKSKQNNFKKIYVKLWHRILELLKTDRAVRANVQYIPQIQLICDMEKYIDSKMALEIFNTRKELTTPLLLQFFDIRNDETRQKVMEKCSKKQLGMIETSTLINAEQE
ncbi:hypothetical protein DOL94_15325 [Acinetobacter baumannii]|mgnify:FL=1|uniref:Uncharacterized protein n=1 Tax=Acinetobacter baumannii TaxID=470 RepID=A0A3F3MK31_ACIBA|nr:hypothetical protein [Acinetobacter baumannii]MDD4854069.1 hypothetical protein [Acinetobacter towneri]PZM13335.1 hypothetical protein DOL94_15325 [Acinetobacter baumannii]